MVALKIETPIERMAITLYQLQNPDTQVAWRDQDVQTQKWYVGRVAQAIYPR